VGALVRATEFRDPYTAGHQLKVAELSQQIGRRLGLTECEVREIELGASLHDIGKIGVPFEILARPGPLSPPEFDIMRTHCEMGQQILTGVDLPPVVGDIVVHHHERLDGSGYPHGLRASAISLGVRIVAVADVIDAMSSDRPYRPSLGLDAACAEISANQGKRYDPDVASAALAIIHASPPFAHHGTDLRNSRRMSLRAKETHV
jgi:putative nucleotidyltransferase with HDIG domain